MDIVERLRQRSGEYDEYAWHSEIELEAADEIEKLRAENAELQRRLELMRSFMMQTHDPVYPRNDMWEIFCRDHCNEARSWFPGSGEEAECSHCGGFGEVSGEYPGVACPVCYGNPRGEDTT